jgi:aminomethyltransferase
MLTVEPSQSSFTDIPPPLGELVAEYRIDAATAIAYPVQAGQYIQIIDVEGSQCSDFLAFAGLGYSEELDGTVTRTLNGVAMPQAGLHGKYFSQNMQPLVETIQDTCGRHDSFLLACTDRYYEDAGYPGHVSCSQNFNLALQPYGIAPRPGWAAVNFFFNTQVDETGAIASGESWSRPGDYVLLRACQDLLCASSACPDDIDPANGWHPTPIHVRIYAAEASFPKAIGRRVAPEIPVRLTKDSGFTPSIRKLTSNLVEYNGFWVPNSFANYGDHAEYWALRERAVVMDLSALRKFIISGANALELLQLAFSRNVAKLAIGQSAYGCLLNPHGGIIDDGIVFRLGDRHAPLAPLVPNSENGDSTQQNDPAFLYVGNCDTNEHWLRQVAQQHSLNATVTTVSDRLHNVALQGPFSRQILQSLVQLAPGYGAQTLAELDYFHFACGTVADIPTLISRTGYTGELGYELFVQPTDAPALWEALIRAGQPFGLLPMGMLALDRARIEAGLLSRGHEFDDLTSPYQAGIGWTVALKTKEHFIGRSALTQLKAHPPRVAVGLVLDSNEVAACGQCIFAAGERWRVGTITSGTFSPILNRSIALAQVVPEYAELGTVLEIGFMDGLKRRIRAIVGPLSAYDPQKTRVRA